MSDFSKTWKAMSVEQRIVARLRVWSDWLNERCPDTEVRNDLQAAADELERLRVIVQGWEHSARNAERDMETLRAERDEARREVCRCLGNPPIVNIAEGIATERGWDCFKEDTDGR